MEMPNASQIAAIAAGIGLLLQQVMVVSPTANRADANRDANFSCRDALAQEREDNKRLLDRLLEQQ